MGGSSDPGSKPLLSHVCSPPRGRTRTNAVMAEQPKKRTFKKYSYRGIDLDKLLDMSNQDLMELFRSRQRRKFSRGIGRKTITVLKKCRKASASQDAPSEHGDCSRIDWQCCRSVQREAV